MPTSIILDIETLSLRPSALITEIGVLAFNHADFVPVDELLLFPGFFAQIQLGRHICNETVQFHQKKGSLPTQVGDQCPKESMRALSTFIAAHNPAHVWIQGPDFDRPIIEDLCRQLGVDMPWKYYLTADARTAWNLAFPGQKHDPRPHHALPDCKATLNDLARSLIALGSRHAA